MLAPVRPAVLSLLVALAFVTLSGCTAGPVDYAGKVVDDTVTLQVPALGMPAVDLDAGFAPGASGGSGGSVRAERSRMATAVAITGLGSVARVTGVTVEPGDAVVVGQEVARLDSAALDANVGVALAALATAKAQVRVLEDALDTVAASRSSLAEKRTQITRAEAQLVATRAKLATQLAEARALLAQIESLGAGGAPGVPPTGTVPPGGPLPDPAQLRVGIARLTAALAQMDSGLAQVASGRARLASAGAKLRDAQSQLKNVRALSRVAADAADVGVRLARYQRELAVLRSPVDGVMVRVANAGEVLGPGATVAEIRPDGARRVTTWIAPEDLGRLAVGSAAEVTADWFPMGSDPIIGSVRHISPRAEYPPSSFSTSDVHMTRAIRVEVALSPTADQPALPPGAPVDVRFPNK